MPHLNTPEASETIQQALTIIERIDQIRMVKPPTPELFPQFPQLPEIPGFSGSGEGPAAIGPA